MIRNLALVAALAALACAGARPAATGPGSEGPVPDRALGLAKASVFDTPIPPAVHDEASAPGEKGVMPRAFPGAPPDVPHGVADLLPITPGENACVACHAIPGPKVKGEPTPIPASHYADLRRAAGGSPAREVVGARYNCLLCHVSRTDAQPLVGNRFAGGR